MAGPKRWPFGTAALSTAPLAIAGPTDAPVTATPGCWTSLMLKKSPLTAATAPLALASLETAARAATAPGWRRLTRTRELLRSTLSRCAWVTPLAALMSKCA